VRAYVVSDSKKDRIRTPGIREFDYKRKRDGVSRSAARLMSAGASELLIKSEAQSPCLKPDTTGYELPRKGV
jgi:hypothetical protein